MNLNKQETAIVLAALRIYQIRGYAENPKLLPHDIVNIATNGGRHKPLNDNDIDDLCERINCETPESHCFENYYQHCDSEWIDTWSCISNSECPQCDSKIEPYKSIELIHGKTIDHVKP